MKTALTIILSVVVALGVVAGAGAVAHQKGWLTLTWPQGSQAEEDDPHAGHDCDGNRETEDGETHRADDAKHDAHEAEGHDDHGGTGHDGHAHTERIPVTKEQVIRLGIKISRARLGAVRREVRVPGEIKIDSDRLTHVVPRAAGIVREVVKSVGDRVKAGEILAWVESDELAKAKLDFYEKQAEVGCCEVKLPRAKAIFENVAKLIALLKKEPAYESVRKYDALEMGEYRGQLLEAYVSYRSALATHKRETGLRAKNIASAQELLDAETALGKAQAKFHAVMDTARYNTWIAYTEALQERQVAVFNAVAAEKQLRLKGADDEVVAKLRDLVPKVAGMAPCDCDDPNCKEGAVPSVADALRKNERFAWYALRAPFDGTVTEKHIVLGESIDPTIEVFTIADLSSVWVDLAISQDTVSAVQKGHAAVIRLPDGTKGETTVDFVSPIVAADTRTALARTTVPNPKGLFRPGTFVDGGILVPSKKGTVLVPKSSVQLVHDHPCVFVWGKADFELREVETGVADGGQIEIVRGLRPGEAVASEGAFHLKAELAKSAAGDGGAHAGHSH